LRWSSLEISIGEISGDCLAIFWKGGRASGVVVEEGLWLRKSPVFEECLVALVGFPGSVGCFLVKHQKEGLVLRSGL